jgi:excinuclease ABC subunit C
MSPLKDKIKGTPSSPGVYLWKSKAGEVIYVGKAKNLRNRVAQYFGQDTRPQLPYLMAEAADLDYVVVGSELESLFLENTLIKQYMPRYNIMLRDDKNYAFIKIDYSTEIPTIGYARKIENDAKTAKYLGPYSSARKIRDTLDFVRKIFPYCNNSQIGKRPCFYYHLHRCPGICINAIPLADYQKQIDRIALFLSGKTAEIKKELAVGMKTAAADKRFELAARLRDQLRAIEILDERQAVMFAQRVNWDFVSVHHQMGLASINLFKVREGRLMDKENFIYQDGYTRIKFEQPDNPAAKAVPAILETFLERYYSEASDIPREVYIEQKTENKNLVEQLASRRAGRKVSLSVPTRGKKLQLIKLGKTNAQEYLRKWQQSQASSSDVLGAALEQLKNILGLPKLPSRIEGYDISNIQGTNPVGSMVVAKDGALARGEYRKFKINVKNTPDDFAMMEEMLTRRVARISNIQYPISNEPNTNADPNIKPEGENSKSSWPIPDLMLIDGGKGQLAVAAKVIEKAGLQIPVIGLAKRIEEIFIPDKSEPIILSHSEPALQLLQRLRDEAHRFAITFHRKLRGNASLKSSLDDISGIGPKTKKLLKQKFGTISQIKQAPPEELEKIIGKRKTELLRKHL